MNAIFAFIFTFIGFLFGIALPDTVTTEIFERIPSYNFEVLAIFWVGTMVVVGVIDWWDNL